MNKSLQDQLLNAGLVDAKKAKKISKTKRKEDKEKRRNKAISLTDSQQAALEMQKDKKARDKQLNAQRKAEEDKKAIAAQVTQLIRRYRVNKDKGDSPYNFKDGKKVKKIYVTDTQTDEIARGRLCIARVGDKYELVPRPVADKIRERDETSIVVFNENNAQLQDKVLDEDESYYAQFEIPDDLMW